MVEDDGKTTGGENISGTAKLLDNKVAQDTGEYHRTAPQYHWCVTVRTSVTPTHSQKRRSWGKPLRVGARREGSVRTHGFPGSAGAGSCREGTRGALLGEEPGRNRKGADADRLQGRLSDLLRVRGCTQRWLGTGGSSGESSEYRGLPRKRSSCKHVGDSRCSVTTAQRTGAPPLHVTTKQSLANS